MGEPDISPLTGNELGDDEFAMLADFRYALRQFLHFSERAVREVGLSPQQHQALLAIRGTRGGERVTIGELAERLQILSHSASGLVSRLVEQGLVARVNDTVDRRQTYVVLTARANQLLEQLSVAHREELRRIGPHLNLLLARLSQPD